MSFASTRRAALGLVLLASGCSTSNATSAAVGPAPYPAPSTGAAVTFDADGTLTAAPSQSIALGLSVTGGDAEVAVWLGGDYIDASLSADTVTTQGGHGVVTLRAPSVATTFMVGAKIGDGAAVYLAVSISAGGFASVRVVPSYAGHRTASSFRASVFVHTTCADLSKGAIKDGVPAVDGTLQQAVTIADVPAGAHVAIAVRIARYATGCTDIDSLVPATSRDVDVELYDVPMALDQTSLDVSFAFDPDATQTAAWGSMLAAVTEQTESGFFGGNESAALLNAIRATIASAADQAQFDLTRTQSGWDAKVASWLSARTPSLHDRALAWLSATKTDPIGPLGLRITATDSNGMANALALSFASLQPGDIGLSASPTFAWTSDAADGVHLSGAVAFSVASLTSRLADGHAVHDYPASVGVASALALGIDCAGLAQSLVGAGALYGQCAASCAADACRSAIESTWEGATASTASTSIKITASAQANVGDDAQPISFSGDWVGQLTGPGASFSMKGSATAKKH